MENLSNDFLASSFHILRSNSQKNELEKEEKINLEGQLKERGRKYREQVFRNQTKTATIMWIVKQIRRLISFWFSSSLRTEANGSQPRAVIKDFVVR